MQRRIPGPQGRELDPSASIAQAAHPFIMVFCSSAAFKGMDHDVELWALAFKGAAKMKGTA